MIEDYRTGLACALGVVGTLLVLSNIPWGGWMFIALLVIGFWRLGGEICLGLLDWIEEARAGTRKEREAKMLEESFNQPPAKSSVLVVR